MVDLNIELPEKFFDDEVRCGYTITHEVKELWAVELDLLNEFQRVCNEYGLKYFACGGTLLGAVRHKGFIPWDDDIDVVMFRRDYEKLKEIGQKAFNKGYFLQNTYNDRIVRQHMQLRKNGTTAFIKSDYGKKCHRGIFIDIFVYDNVPLDDVELEVFRKKSSDYYHKIVGSTVDIAICKLRGVRDLFDFGKKIIKKIFLFITDGGKNKAFMRYENMVQTYNDKNTGIIANISFLCDKKKVHLYKEDSFNETIMLPFEHMSIACPIGFDDNLKSQYGNYMEFVTGTSMHGGLFFDTGKSYMEYKGISYKEFCDLFE